MVSQRALSEYQQVNTQTLAESASPHRLIQMLMQGCLQRVAEAKGALMRKDIAAKGLAISKAIDRSRQRIAAAVGVALRLHAAPTARSES